MKRIIFMFIVNFFRLPYMLGWLFRYSNHRDLYTRERRYDFIHRMVPWAANPGRVKMIVKGTEKLPKDTSYIMFPNHQGLFDTLTLLSSVETPFSIVVKKELEHVSMLHNVLDTLDAEYMDREDIRQSMKIIQNVAKRVQAGQNFVIYPEGTRSRQGNNMLEFKAGAFKAAMMAKCPIVPVALIDCFTPFDVPSIKRVTVQAHILEPIPYEEYKDMKSHEIAAMVQEKIRIKITEVTGIESKVVFPVNQSASQSGK